MLEDQRTWCDDDDNDSDEQSVTVIYYSYSLVNWICGSLTYLLTVEYQILWSSSVADILCYLMAALFIKRFTLR